MFSKRELEGYLLIDHRESEGITPEQAAKAGKDTMPVGRGVRFESATYNCCGCQRLIVKNPLRTRERTYCPSCDRYKCDECTAAEAVTGVHIPFKRRLDEFINRAAKGIVSDGQANSFGNDHHANRDG